MADLPFPLDGTTLVTGPANAGKTRLTARALDAWVTERGPDGVVVLDFAPEVERDGRILGGHLDRFTELPDGVWSGVLDAHAPRADGQSAAETLDLAAANARHAERIVRGAPDDPLAVFVNDATIPFQSGDVAVTLLTDYCDGAETAVCNAFESDELGVEDPVSRHERAVLDALRSWSDRVVEL